MQNPIEGAGGIQRLNAIVFVPVEARFGSQMRQVLPAARDQVVGANHFMAIGNEARSEVTTEEAGHAGNENSHRLYST